MPDETFEPLSVDELAAIDAQYRSFPAFGDWPKEVPEAELWRRSRDELQAAVDQAADVDVQRSQSMIRRAAAFDTGSIEGLYSTNRGLTFTVAQQAAEWEQQVDAQNPNALELFEAQLQAFELVLDHVTTQIPKITQAWLRRIHEVITAPQQTYVVHTPVGTQEQPLPKGKYKEYPNHVRTPDGEVHAYAPVESTQSEMQRLVDELEAPEFQHAHPVVQASYTHYGLVAIHPFADGNGRLARAVSSAYTYRDASIPLMVLDEHRALYLEALAQADAGNASSFVGVVDLVTRETMDLIRDTLKTAIAPQPDVLLTEFENLYRDEEHRQHSVRVTRSAVDWLVDMAKERISDVDTPNGVELKVELLEKTRQPPPDGFRQVDLDGARSFRVTFESAPPANASLPRRVDIFVGTGDSEGSLLLKGVQGPQEELLLKRTDLEPVSSLAQRRVENYLRRLLGDGLDELLQKAREQVGE